MDVSIPPSSLQSSSVRNSSLQSSSVRNSSASVDTAMTQVDSSNPDGVEKPAFSRFGAGAGSEHPEYARAPSTGEDSGGVHSVEVEESRRDIKLSVKELELWKKEKTFLRDNEAELNKRKRMIVCIVSLLCLAGVVQGVLVNGLINVVISSLEKRFGIQSTESGLVASSYDIASFLCLLPVSYLGGRGTGSKPTWISGGIFLMGVGSLVFTLPHFLSDIYTGGAGDPQADQSISYCNQSISCSTSKQLRGENHFKYVFMGAQLLHGAGAAPLYTLGVTYIDENIGSGDSAFFLGVFYTMAIVGPALGYAMGGQFLNIHTDFSSVDVDYKSPGSDWIGAWWLGFLACGFFSLILSVFIFLLPAHLPGVQDPPGDQVCRSRLPSRASSFRSSFKTRSVKPKEGIDLTGGGGPLPVGKELLSALIILLTNPTFVFISLAGASEGFLMQGLATFLPKLIQNQYSLSEAQAAVHVGAVSVVAGGGGTLVGGLIVKRFSLKVEGLLKLTSITQFLAVISALGLLASCPNQRRIHGAADGDEEDCSADCECESFDYTPVCIGTEQFFNPCWAGCSGFNHTANRYQNCSCAADTINASLVEHDAVSVDGVPGLCPTTCSFLPVFLVSFFFTMIITFMANMPTLTATLRCVDPDVRSLALGIQWLLIRLLGTIPGPVAMGRLLDSNCNHWRKGCSGPEDCLLYDNTNVSKLIMLQTALCKGLTIVAFLIGMRLYKPPSTGETYVADEVSNPGEKSAAS